MACTEGPVVSMWCIMLWRTGILGEYGCRSDGDALRMSTNWCSGLMADSKVVTPLVVLAEVESSVSGSISLCPRTSTIRLKYWKKSAPKMACDTAST